MNKSTMLLVIFLIYSISFSQTFNPFSQNNVHGGFSIDVFGGSNTPLNDLKSFVGKGNGAGITFRKNISNNFSLDISGNYNSFLVNDEINSIVNNWSSSSITLGPQYKFNFLMFSFGVYGKIGYSFLNIPKAELFYPESQIITDKFENNTGNTLDGHFGANLSFKIFDGIRIMGNFDYSKNLGNKIDYQARDISEAINEKGRILVDVAEQIPFENKSIGFSSMAFSVGISIDICGSCSHKTLKEQNWNSTQNHKRSRIGTPNGNGNNNQYNNGENVRNGNNGNGEENNNIPPSINAQDWNSSRSNKTSKTSRVGNPNGDGNNNPIEIKNKKPNKKNKNSKNSNPNKNGNKNPAKAQDWNSSRSNKTSKTS